MNAPHLKPSAMRDLERKFDMEKRAMELIGVIAAEFESDPMSVQCFDLRIVEEVKKIAREYSKLKDFF